MIIFLSNFTDNFQECYKYNIRYSTKYANRIKDSILTSIDRLNNFPYIGNYLLDDESRKYREIICQKYRIIYSLSDSDDIVYIHYIIYSGINFRAFFKIYNRKNKINKSSNI